MTVLGFRILHSSSSQEQIKPTGKRLVASGEYFTSIIYEYSPLATDTEGKIGLVYI